MVVQAYFVCVTSQALELGVGWRRRGETLLLQGGYLCDTYMIRTQKVMYNMFFVHLKAYLRVTVDFAAHSVTARFKSILDRTAP